MPTPSLPWLACFDPSPPPVRLADALAPLRAHPGLRILPAPLWLDGPALTSELEIALRSLPGLQLLQLHPDGLLRAPGRILPAPFPPPPANARWFPLREFLLPRLPAIAAAPASPPSGVALRLVPATAWTPPAALLTTLAEFAAWTATAPEIRLAPLSHALDSRQRCLVRGRPLPPVPGQFLADHHAILLPVSHHWRPALPAPLLRLALGLQAGETALLLPGPEPTGFTWERLPATAFLPTTRAALRNQSET